MELDRTEELVLGTTMVHLGALPTGQLLIGRGQTLLFLDNGSAGVYYQLLPNREMVERWGVRAVACLAFGLLSLLCIAYTNPESPLSTVPFALLIVGAIVAYRGLYREWANPHP